MGKLGDTDPHILDISAACKSAVIQYIT